MPGFVMPAKAGIQFPLQQPVKRRSVDGVEKIVHIQLQKPALAAAGVLLRPHEGLQPVHRRVAAFACAVGIAVVNKHRLIQRL